MNSVVTEALGGILSICKNVVLPKHSQQQHARKAERKKLFTLLNSKHATLTHLLILEDFVDEFLQKENSQDEKLRKEFEAEIFSFSCQVFNEHLNAQLAVHEENKVFILEHLQSISIASAVSKFTNEKDFAETLLAMIRRDDVDANPEMLAFLTYMHSPHALREQWFLEYFAEVIAMFQTCVNDYLCEQQSSNEGLCTTVQTSSKGQVPSLEKLKKAAVLLNTILQSSITESRGNYFLNFTQKNSVDYLALIEAFQLLDKNFEALKDELMVTILLIVDFFNRIPFCTVREEETNQFAEIINQVAMNAMNRDKYPILVAAKAEKLLKNAHLVTQETLERMLHSLLQTVAKLLQRHYPFENANQLHFTSLYRADFPYRSSECDTLPAIPRSRTKLHVRQVLNDIEALLKSESAEKDGNQAGLRHLEKVLSAISSNSWQQEFVWNYIFNQFCNDDLDPYEKAATCFALALVHTNIAPQVCQRVAQEISKNSYPTMPIMYYALLHKHLERRDEHQGISTIPIVKALKIRPKETIPLLFILYMQAFRNGLGEIEDEAAVEVVNAALPFIRLETEISEMKTHISLTVIRSLQSKFSAQLTEELLCKTIALLFRLYEDSRGSQLFNEGCRLLISIMTKCRNVKKLSGIFKTQLLRFLPLLAKSFKNMNAFRVEQYSVDCEVLQEICSFIPADEVYPFFQDAQELFAALKKGKMTTLYLRSPLCTHMPAFLMHMANQAGSTAAAFDFATSLRNDLPAVSSHFLHHQFSAISIIKNPQLRYTLLKCAVSIILKRSVQVIEWIEEDNAFQFDSTEFYAQVPCTNITSIVFIYYQTRRELPEMQGTSFFQQFALKHRQLVSVQFVSQLILSFCGYLLYDKEITREDKLATEEHEYFGLLMFLEEVEKRPELFKSILSGKLKDESSFTPRVLWEATALLLIGIWCYINHHLILDTQLRLRISHLLQSIKNYVAIHEGLVKWQKSEWLWNSSSRPWQQLRKRFGVIKLSPDDILQCVGCKVLVSTFTDVTIVSKQ